MTQPSSTPDDGSDSGADRDVPGPDEVYCRDCGAVISERAEICPSCGVRQRDPPSSTLDDVLAGGNPAVAAALSALLPGLGQLYNRELERGLAFLVGSMLAAFSVVLFGLGLILYPAVWLYAIYDAYRGAERFATEQADESSTDAGGAEESDNEDGGDADSADGDDPA